MAHIVDFLVPKLTILNITACSYNTTITTTNNNDVIQHIIMS